MAADEPEGGRSGTAGNSHRNGFAAGGALAGFVVAGILSGLGASHWQAAGMALLVTGAVLWFGGMRVDPATLAAGEAASRQRYRSRAIALGLGALVLIFYVATLVRLGPNALRKDLYSGQVGAAKNVIIEDKGIVVPACKQAGTC
jgi:hypothetical protein